MYLPFLGCAGEFGARGGRWGSQEESGRPRRARAHGSGQLIGRDESSEKSLLIASTEHI